MLVKWNFSFLVLKFKKFPIITGSKHFWKLNFSGGTVNLILLCSLPESFHPSKLKEPIKVVFRIYCKPDSDIISETVICSILAEKGLGPKLYGIFEGGRIEEYMPVKML